ncbi:oxidoreductase [Tateyamaria omphalii]|uniref:Gfo/Idh/MocA family protein n=1 Tax=Tateyamaria omphalii TaxID=299262 RepID=UPI001673456D|nr:Gfo/Idh/MocA family oxidoreductase [Tateyamaria omphalii]GGX65586.1 oxidoreductase [Tateyamaria omphalii]
MQGIGIIGCGNISTAYLTLAPLFKGLEVRAVADLNIEAANAQAEKFGVRAHTVKDLLAADDIDIVVNLTIPDAHFEVTRAILQAGKHAYSEKPIVLTQAQGEELRALATVQNLRIGSAPDTFLGGAHQAARAALDAGQIGDVVAGTAHVMSHGMEHWHPNPDFFFLPGAGPMLDIGPYYVTNLIQLLGPVRRVGALATTPADTRTILSEPRRGEIIPVKTPTNIHALLEFQTGASITLSTSWDVWAHRHGHMELYGTSGSMFLPDPNWFSGDVEIVSAEGETTALETDTHPFGIPNQENNGVAKANYRTAGLADMAAAMNADRPHRCSLELALHAVDVMTSVLDAGERGEMITLNSTCARPEPLTADAARALLK